jgi:hypothetical protein
LSFSHRPQKHLAAATRQQRLQQHGSSACSNTAAAPAATRQQRLQQIEQSYPQRVLEL